MAGRQTRWQVDSDREPNLLSRREGDLLGAANNLGQAERPFGATRHRFAAVIDDHDLFLEAFARVEIMVFAGESGWLAGNVGQQWPVIAHERLCGGRGKPVRALEGEVHSLVTLVEEVGTE